MPVVTLNQRFVDQEIRCPDGKKRLEYCDTEVPGLYALANPGNTSTYYLRYKDANGKTCHQKIARTADISLAEARKRAKTLKAQVSLGADPRGQERARKEVMTFDEFFAAHYLPFVKPRKRSWKSDERLYVNRIHDKFGTSRLNQITRQQILTFHTDLLATGLAGGTCDHHVRLIRRCLNLALDWGHLTGTNPAARIPLFNIDNKVENYMQEEELARLLHVLRTDKNQAISRIALFLLSTGARLNEGLKAEWSQVDLENRVWRIPATNSKSKRVRSVPLNDSALDVLKQLDTKGKYDYLFINRRTKTRYTSIMKVWVRLRAKAGLPHLRIHDLRHQFASFLVNSGQSLYSVQSILGHSDPKVTMRYSHLSSKALQDAANSASIAIKEATLTAR